MPTFMQPSTKRVEELPEGTLPTSEAFGKNLVERYGVQTAPAFKEAQRRARSNVHAAGLGGSGIEQSNQLGLEQSRMADMGRFAGEVGEKQAEFNQADKVREMLRKYQVEDRDFSAAERERARADDAQRHQDSLWGDILGVGAGILAGPAGGALFKLLGRGGDGGGLPTNDADGLPFDADGVPIY